MEKNYSYLRIYRDLKKQIVKGQYQNHSQLPTEAELQKVYSVSRITVKKALELLTNDGLIRRFPGRGTFVNMSEDMEISIAESDEKQPIIGVMIPKIYTSFGNSLLEGVAKEANRRGCCLMTGLYYNSLEEENQLIDRLISSGCQGIIVVPFHSPTGSHYGIINSAMRDYPLVMADRYLEGIALPYVGSDHESAAVAAMEHLFSLGHKNVGLISSAPTTTAIIDRERGYMRAFAMVQYQVYPSNLLSDIRSSMPGLYSPENVQTDVDRMKRYLTENPTVTALMCIDYNIMRICSTAAQELGLRVPEDLSLVCFDTPEDEYIRQKYTHVQQPEQEIGRTAVEMLLERIEGNKDPRRVSLGTRLCIGSSTGKPGKRG